MDDASAILKARSFLSKLDIKAPPIDVSLYTGAIGAEIHFDKSLPTGTAGFSTTVGTRKIIVVNDKDSMERQRFTVCHEIAHSVLGLQTDHGSAFNIYGYAKRSPNEILCDIFAAELLLPHKLFNSHMDEMPAEFATIEHLAELFQASLSSTGSRFAASANEQCAFVLSTGARVRYASLSIPLRSVGARIPVGSSVPSNSATYRATLGQSVGAVTEIVADNWLSDWRKGGILVEETRYMRQLQQSLTLLVLELETNERDNLRAEEEEEPGLRELDGILKWKKK